MLMLTRRVGESVDLIDSTTGRPVAAVQVLALLPNDVVRLGFLAPPHISILRDNAKRRTDNGDEEESDTNGNR